MRKHNLAVLIGVLAAATVKAGPIVGTPSPAVVFFQTGTTVSFVTPTFVPLAGGLLGFSASQAVGGVSFNLTGTYNPDPWMEWSLEMFSTNSAVLSNVRVGVSFGSQGGPYDTMTSAMSGTLRDVNGDGGGALNVTHFPTIGLTSQLGLGLGSDCSILGTHPANTVHSCGSYGPVTDGVSAGINPALGFVFDSSLVAADFITYSGRITLENADAAAVPEPRASAMMILAAGVVLWLRSRRRGEARD
jgi:hypothetical protein